MSQMVDYRREISTVLVFLENLNTSEKRRIALRRTPRKELSQNQKSAESESRFLSGDK